MRISSLLAWVGLTHGVSKMTEELFKKTRLYQNLYKALGNDIDFDEIVANYLQVITSGKGRKFNFEDTGDSSNVDEAFIWSSTAQGREYWGNVHHRYLGVR
jgi:hypothetical protein